MKKILTILVLVILCYESFAQQVDSYSKTSCFVEIFRDSRLLGNASGFFLSTKSNIYFITNNHVVGGKFYRDEYLRNHKHIVPNDSVPNKLVIRVYGQPINSSFKITLPINNSCINFFSNKDTTKLMDVVAIPLNDAVKTQLKNTVILSSQNVNPELIIAPSTELYIVGFPFDYGKSNVYPVWKRGTVANEPSLKAVGNSNFLIDATTRAGMSGSPVFYRNTSFVTKTSPINVTGQLNTFLVGIYSAQIYIMELGMVWDLQAVIDELNDRK